MLKAEEHKLKEEGGRQTTDVRGQMAEGGRSSKAEMLKAES